MTCGSSYKNKGVQELLDAVVDYLPSPVDIPAIKGVDLDGNEIERKPKEINREYKYVEDLLRDKLDTKVKIKDRKVEKGYVADLAILDIKNKRKYTKEEILSLSKNTPYIGMEMIGFPRYTLVNGKIVWRDENEK